MQSRGGVAGSRRLESSAWALGHGVPDSTYTRLSHLCHVPASVAPATPELNRCAVISQPDRRAMTGDVPIPSPAMNPTPREQEDRPRATVTGILMTWYASAGSRPQPSTAATWG